MGWSLGWDSRYDRDIGYGVPAYCDHPECSEEIDRGLAYVCCGQQPYGGDEGCGLYFCSKHRNGWDGKCERCDLLPSQDDESDDADELTAAWPGPFDPKPDHPEWVRFKLTDESWEEWRAENPKDVAAMKAGLATLPLESAAGATDSPSPRDADNRPTATNVVAVRSQEDSANG